MSFDLREHISRVHTQFHKVDRRDLDELAGAHGRMHARYPRLHAHAHGPDGEAVPLPDIAVDLPAWVGRLPVVRLGRLSAFLSREHIRRMAADDWTGAGDLGPWGEAVWNLWCDKRWGGAGRYPPK